MDPASIAAATSSLVFSIVRNGRALAMIFEKYQDAQRCLFLIQTECTVLAAALSQLQIFFSNTTVSSHREYPDTVVQALDLALVGCTLTLSVLDKEIKDLTDRRDGIEAKLSRDKRAKYVWKEELMHELLQQLRGQSSALTLLLKALDSSSIDEILRIVRSGQQTFRGVCEGAASIRRTHPQEHYAESILDMSFDDTKTIYSVEPTETNESTKIEDPVSSISTSLESSPLDSNTESSDARDCLPEGWVTRYSVQYNRWFFVDTTTGKSQWERPDNPTHLSQGTGAGKSLEVPMRKPIPAANVRPSELRSANITPNSSSIDVNSQRNPSSLENADEGFDFAPWAVNTHKKFQTVLDNLRRDLSVPALAVGVLSAEKPPEIHILGARKQGCATPVTRADRFTIANSNAVTLTALAVMIDRGVFKWDETIVEILPSLAQQTHPFHHQTTLAMLGAHRSGLTTVITSAENGDLYRYLRRRDVSPGQGRFATAVSYLVRPPDATPGTSTSWNWVNPMLIALAMEERTSTPFESLVKLLVFDPLEMYSAGFGRPDAARNASTPDTPSQPWGHNEAKDPLNPLQTDLFVPPALSASARVHCSIPDFAAFVALHLRCAMRLPVALLNPQSAEKLHSRLTDEEWGTPGSWWLAPRDWAGGEAVYTDGRCDGFAVSIWMAPLKGKAFFSVANVDGDVGVKVTNEAVSSAIRYDQSKDGV